MFSLLPFQVTFSYGGGWNEQVALHLTDYMYEQLNDLASQHHIQMSLYTRMLSVQACKIGPEVRRSREESR